MSEDYIKKHFLSIKEFATVIENRLDDDYYTIDVALEDNKKILNLAQKYNVNYVLIDDKYEIKLDL